MTGRIHSLESFGTADGPGIRFVVFLQGCRWRCRYCHNPDTWALQGGKEMEVDALFGTLLRYRSWFDASGGGVTVSGGEPLLQAAFVTELFGRLKHAGIHTALDTNGDWQEEPDGGRKLEALLSVTDLVLLDIKHPDPEAHLALTGAEAASTLHFLDCLRQRSLPTWLRYVVVPGLTDSPPAIASIRRLKDTHPNVTGIQWLPYHRMGIFKWHEAGIPYTLEEVPAADAAFMDQLRDNSTEDSR